MVRPPRERNVDPTMVGFEGLFEQAELLKAIGVLLKVGLAVVLGAAIGWEREQHGRPAGIRTHMLIILGVTLICEVSKAFNDPSPGRIAAGIITGIGFLGAGSILRIGTDVKGLTTAASIWATAAIGMAVSVGGAFLYVAIASTILTLVTLSWVDKIERRLIPTGHPSALLVTLSDKNQIAALIQGLRDGNVSTLGFRVLEGAGPYQVIVDVQNRHEGLLALVMSIHGVVGAKWAD